MGRPQSSRWVFLANSAENCAGWRPEPLYVATAHSGLHVSPLKVMNHLFILGLSRARERAVSVPPLPHLIHVVANPAHHRLDHSSTCTSRSARSWSCLDSKLISPSKLISHPDRIHFVFILKLADSDTLHSLSFPWLNDGSKLWFSGSSPSLACMVFLAQCPPLLTFFSPLLLP